MMMGTPLSLGETIGARPYPGRACLLATVRGERVIVYFLTGRSEASRQRNLNAEAGSVFVVDADSSSHDPLRHYRAIAGADDWIVVGNGSHVDKVLTSLVTGRGPFEIMSTMSAEPDPPIYTPRIWVAVQRGQPQSASIFGHVSCRPDGGTTRCIWSVDELADDVAVLMTTYSGTVKDVKVTEGPTYVSFHADSATDLIQLVWNCLDPQLRVGAVLVFPDAVETISIVGPLISGDLSG